MLTLSFMFTICSKLFSHNKQVSSSVSNHCWYVSSSNMLMISIPHLFCLIVVCNLMLLVIDNNWININLMVKCMMRLESHYSGSLNINISSKLLSTN